MKNPKVGERVAYDGQSTVRLRGTIEEICDDGQVLINPDRKGHYRDMRFAHQLTRLVPKKRERTYTEAEVKAAFDEVGATPELTSTVWEIVQKNLREGSGK